MAPRLVLASASPRRAHILRALGVPFRAEAAGVDEALLPGEDAAGAAERLARAKAYLLGQFALDRRTNARLAWYQGFFEATGVGHDFDERYRSDVEAVSRADVERVARTYLGPPTTVVLTPIAR